VLAAGRPVRRLAADRAERSGVGHEVHDGEADFGAGAVAGDRHKFFRSVEIDQRPDGVQRSPRRGFGSHASDTTHGLGTDIIVRVGAGDLCQVGNRIQPTNRRPAHPGVPIIASKSEERVLLVGA
jgi:hypothetical protein